MDSAYRNLRLIAEQRYTDPLNTWPDHTRTHRSTILGNFLEDEYCLRCHLERVAAEKIRETQEKLSKAGDNAVA